MANENELDLDSQNQAENIVLSDEDDTDAIREKFSKLSETHKKVSDYNKQLFARAKKAEGFELKDGKWIKPMVEPKPEPKPEAKPDDALLQRMEKIAFKQHNLSHEDDKDLARKTAKKWNMEIEDVLEDEDFQVKLKKQQDSRANVEATSGVKGSAGQASSKTKADYWIGKNTPPTDEDVTANKIPRGELGKIARHFMANKGSGKKFYND